MKIYLAAPYSHHDFAIREWRVDQTNRKAAELMIAGYQVFSPLSHSHPISKYCTVDPCDQKFWLRQDLWILDICDEVHVLCLPGWKESKGIRIEIEHAVTNKIKVIYHDNSNRQAKINYSPDGIA
uniref:DUF1937 domain-containing protein n=1 Tax=viral metagenome TaxID=1070528 RepID=A0A6M3K292_9ZZZZ